MTAAQVTTPRHPWELLLEQLTGSMGLAHGFGTEADAKGPPHNRITWIPGVLGTEAAKFSIEGAEVTDLQTCRFSVLFYAGSPIEVIQRAKELEGWLDLLAGPRQGDFGDPSASPVVPPRPGYDARFTGSAPEGGGTSASSWRLSIQITLKDFVVRRYFPTPTPIASATVQIDATDPSGAEQAIPFLAGAP